MDVEDGVCLTRARRILKNREHFEIGTKPNVFSVGIVSLGFAIFN